MMHLKTFFGAMLALAGFGFASASATDIPATDLLPKAVLAEEAKLTSAQISVDTVWDEIAREGVIVAEESGQLIGIITSSDDTTTKENQAESL